MGYALNVPRALAGKAPGQLCWPVEGSTDNCAASVKVLLKRMRVTEPPLRLVSTPNDDTHHQDKKELSF